MSISSQPKAAIDEHRTDERCWNCRSKLFNYLLLLASSSTNHDITATEIAGYSSLAIFFQQILLRYCSKLLCACRTCWTWELVELMPGSTSEWSFSGHCATEFTDIECRCQQEALWTRSASCSCYQWERKCASTIGSVPVPGLAISSAKILIYFSNKIYWSNFIKQHSKTVMVWNYKNADCSLRQKKLLCHLL